MTTRQFYKQMFELGFGEVVEKLRKRTKAQWKKCEVSGLSREYALSTKDLVSFIGLSFMWELSPEGFEYWSSIQKQVGKK